MKRNMILATVFLVLFLFLTGVGCTGSVDDGYCRGIGHWLLCSRDLGIGACFWNSSSDCASDEVYMEGITYLTEGTHYSIANTQCSLRSEDEATVSVTLEIHGSACRINKLLIYVLDDKGNVVGVYNDYDIYCKAGMNTLTYDISLPFYEGGALTARVVQVEGTL